MKLFWGPLSTIRKFNLFVAKYQEEYRICVTVTFFYDMHTIIITTIIVFTLIIIKIYERVYDSGNKLWTLLRRFNVNYSGWFDYESLDFIKRFQCFDHLVFVLKIWERRSKVSDLTKIECQLCKRRRKVKDLHQRKDKVIETNMYWLKIGRDYKSLMPHDIQLFLLWFIIVQLFHTSSS